MRYNRSLNFNGHVMWISLMVLALEIITAHFWGIV